VGHDPQQIRSPSLSTEEQLALAELKAKLQSQAGSVFQKLILFGSKARGDDDAGSDIDVAIIVAELDSEIRNQIMEIVVGVELDHLTPLASIILSADQMNHLRQRERRLARDIDSEGVLL
jgi:predicted nucleotidyltransferase